MMVSPYPFGICTPLYVHLDLWPFVLCTVHRLLVAKNDELKNPFACGTRGLMGCKKLLMVQKPPGM